MVQIQRLVRYDTNQKSNSVTSRFKIRLEGISSYDVDVRSERVRRERRAGQICWTVWFRTRPGKVEKLLTSSCQTAKTVINWRKPAETTFKMKCAWKNSRIVIYKTKIKWIARLNNAFNEILVLKRRRRTRTLALSLSRRPCLSLPPPPRLWIRFCAGHSFEIVYE